MTREITRPLHSHAPSQLWPRIRLTWRQALLSVAALFLTLDLTVSLSLGAPPFSTSFQIVAKSIAKTIGLIELRDGTLANDKRLLLTLEKQLQPLDVIVISAPFKGTSFFTPGRNTHMAIWLGNETDWAKQGWRDIPRLKPLADAVAEGRSVLQSDRHGTGLSSLDDVLNADEITIFRATHQRDAEIHFDRAIQNMGKAYDYNLDGLDHQTLICTELAMLIFPELRSKPSKRLGRQFILPDEMLRTLEQSDHWQSWFHAGSTADR
ncbi:YiiX/YebB-like N1pC/P60 family cysteine hydrolase [uncultured Cohaesibacter sp.]|uniref:YiiX/YebB-like N1pC/P60 family cysteine hydrolase n=1 Tax=uncultured Cohaesibacter sp. TaxID=1002546 RepID=UPI0029C68B6A|nr:YiiX/YebB-like N1pC/P60 family cysteine hydrolase [uncultured Cohaesibacter sp.]